MPSNSIFGTGDDDQLVGDLPPDAGEPAVVRDFMYGFGGEDSFLPGVGKDTVDGGEGTNDQIMYWDQTDGVTINFVTNTCIDGAGAIDKMVNIEAASGSYFADTIIYGIRVGTH